MMASAISGVTAFYYLQKDGWGIASGAMTAFAVDVALWVVLTGDKLMEAIGITAGPWARAVRWGTALMSVTLNITAAAVANIPDGAKVPLIILHAFVPLVMVALAELRGEYARKLAPKEAEALKAEEDRKRALDTPIVAPSERIFPEDRGLVTPLAPTTSGRELGGVGRTYHPAGTVPMAPGLGQPEALPASRPAYADQPTSPPSSPLPDPKLAGELAELRAELARVKTLATPPKPTVVPIPRRPAPKTSAPSGNSPITDRIINYLNTYHRGDPYGITADKLAQKLKANDHTCKKVLTEWRKTLNQSKSIKEKEAAS
jgi:hypothetical protein